MTLASYIKDHKLTAYVILNYALSWAFLYPAYQAILQAEEGSFPWLALIGLPGGFGPTIAAIIIVWISEGKPAVKELLKKYLIIKVHLKWYLFVLIVPILLYYLAIIVTPLFGFDLGQSAYQAGFKMAIPYLLLALPFGPLMEELGWRGFMLPELLNKYNIYISSLILGVVWTFWHIASFTFPGAAIPSVFEVNFLTISLYLLSTTAHTFIFTYVYLHTRGSVFIAILLHMAFNANSNIVLEIFPDMVENVDHRLCLYVLYILVVSFTALGLFYHHEKTAK